MLLQKQLSTAQRWGLLANLAKRESFHVVGWVLTQITDVPAIA